MKLFESIINPRELRRRLGLNQEAFWTQIGVTQIMRLTELLGQQVEAIPLYM